MKMEGWIRRTHFNSFWFLTRKMPRALVHILAAYFDTKKPELGPPLTLPVPRDLQAAGRWDEAVFIKSLSEASPQQVLNIWYTSDFFFFLVWWENSYFVLILSVKMQFLFSPSIFPQFCFASFESQDRLGKSTSPRSLHVQGQFFVSLDAHR